MMKSFRSLLMYRQSKGSLATPLMMAVGILVASAAESRADDENAASEMRRGDVPVKAEQHGPMTAEVVNKLLETRVDELRRSMQPLIKEHGEESGQVLNAKLELDMLEAGLNAMAAQAEAKSVALKEGRVGDDELSQRMEAYAMQAEESAKQLKARDLQLQMLAQQMGEMNRLQNLPPIVGEVKIFSLAHVPAADAAKHVLSLFGGQAVRVAIDGRTNSLIVFGKSDYHSPIEAILSKLDAQGEGNADAPRTAPSKKPNSRSVLLRVYWLADGLPKGEGEPLEEFLPAGVIKAVGRLGLKDPRLVAQTVNSLASRDEKVAEFSSRVPAVVLHQPAQLTCTGEMWPIVDGRTELQVQLRVSGSLNCELTGSLVLPLSHYMVLGTANSVAGDMAMMPGMAEEGMMGMGRGGRGMGMGRMGRDGMGMEGGGRGGFGGEMGVADSEAVAVAGAGASEPEFNTSRFAFVVQVTDGESYPSEE